MGGVPLASRILRAAPSRLVIELAAAIATLALASAVSRVIPHPHDAFFLVYAPIAIPASFGVYVGLVRWLERRGPLELALPGALRDLGLGLAIGTALFSMTIGVIALLGGYSIDGTASPTVLLAPLAMAASSAFTEEIVARGVVFRILEEWLGTWAALAFSGVLFGLAHIANPHATVWSALAIGIEAGPLLAAAYMLTRRLWLPIGIHAAWNYTQGAVFGVAVSGGKMTGLFHGTMRGPEWLSGGEFGAEASAGAVVVCALGAAILLAKAVRAGHVLAPSWVRRRRGA